MARKLTAKRLKYVRLRVGGKKPSESYRGSGYSVKRMSAGAIATEAYKLEQNPQIALMIKEGEEKAVTSSIMTRTQALQRLSFHANIKITDVYDFTIEEIARDPKGEAIMGPVWKLKDMADISPDVAACIKSVSNGKNGPQVELCDPDGAIKQLGLMQGWNAAQLFDHSSKDGTMSPNRELSDDEIQEQMKARGLAVTFDK